MRVVDFIVKFLKDEDYEINEEGKSVLLTNNGMEVSEKLLLENKLIEGGTLSPI